MKARFIRMGSLLLLLGCTAAATQKTELPSLASLHPVGYPRLVDLVPECTRPNREAYESCLVAAQMLESSTNQVSTHRFLTHWEKAAFGDPADPAAIEATERIVIPVLKFLYRFSKDTYTKTMIQKADQIRLTSRDSFESFTQTHKCLINGKKPSECLKL